MRNVKHLEQVRWTHAVDDGRGARSDILHDLGVAHGFCGRTGGAPEPQHVRQVHGVDIVDARTARLDTPADGIYTEAQGRPVAVKTADCVPLLFSDEKRKLVMAVHAGWRGLTGGIVHAAARRYAEHGIGAGEIYCAIGPAIGLNAFEVGPEVIAALHAKPCGLDEAQAALCTAKGKGDRWHADLKTAAALILVNEGLAPERIEVVQACTYELKSTWFSYRREGKGVSSNWSWISL